MNKPRVGIFGAGSPIGLELMRWLSVHPMIELAFVSDQKLAGKLVKEEFPGLATNVKLAFCEQDSEQVQDLELLFSALPLREAMDFLPHLRRTHPKIKLVDCSALFRPCDTEFFARLYKERHPAPEMLDDFAYGLTHRRVQDIAEASCVAVPGSFAAAIITALEPIASVDLLQNSIFSVGTIGTSELGRDISGFADNHQGSNISHFQLLEHPQALELNYWLGRGPEPAFNIYLAPQFSGLRRGLFTTIFLELSKTLTIGSLNTLYEEYYQGATFVSLLHSPPELKDVLHSNRCHFSLRILDDTLCISVALDNLGFGSAMKAIECANCMLGLPPEAGLFFPGLSS